MQNSLRDPAMSGGSAQPPTQKQRDKEGPGNATRQGSLSDHCGHWQRKPAGAGELKEQVLREWGWGPLTSSQSVSRAPVREAMTELIKKR